MNTKTSIKKNLSIKLILLLLIFVNTSLIGCNNDSDADAGTEDTVDNIAPTITCISNINETVDAGSNGKEITFTAPMGTDNMPGVVTTQTEGLASGETFPVGTTTNSYEVKDAAGNTASCSFSVIIKRNEPSSNTPFFIGSDPAPSGKSWSKVENLSDEFNDGIFDEDKWLNTDPKRWIGRPPGIFKKIQ